MESLSALVREGDPGEIGKRIAAGANPGWRDENGYTLAILAACAGRADVVELLWKHGAPVEGESCYGESVLSLLSNWGYFGLIGKLLDAGVDPAPLQWSPLHRAVAVGSLEDVCGVLDGGADLEAGDRWERSALLVALAGGETAKAVLLLSRGANRDATGRCGKTVCHYPLARDDADTLRWLIGNGFDIDREDGHGRPPLVDAAEDGAVECFKLLADSGAEWDAYRDELEFAVGHPEIAREFLMRGKAVGGIEDEIVRKMIGVRVVDELPVSEREYLDGRFRRFGKANPERMEVPFWNAMVRNGWDAYRAAQRFDDESFERDNPVWCHDRFGMSLTPLPDGRFVQIAGEHEDHYDPDFCIYNDVVVHDGMGGFEILGYPKDVFPPTDFHSATLVGGWIYLIGNLGYPETREAFGYQAPVFRFHVETGRIERVETTGEAPGWIHRHQARLEGNAIRIEGGKRFLIDGEGNPGIVDNADAWALELDGFTWRRLG
ncbi:MAG: ankyrin repeat domain-containing protein [Verrucomicrobiales bacterium]